MGWLENMSRMSWRERKDDIWKENTRFFCCFFWSVKPLLFLERRLWGAPQPFFDKNAPRWTYEGFHHPYPPLLQRSSTFFEASPTHFSKTSLHLNSFFFKKMVIWCCVCATTFLPAISRWIASRDMVAQQLPPCHGPRCCRGWDAWLRGI